MRARFLLLVALLSLSPVADAAPVESLKVATFNIWSITDAPRLQRIANVVAASGADIVGLQEANSVADDIAALVPGMSYFYRASTSLSFISKYPLLGQSVAPGGRSAGVRVELSPGQFVNVFNNHFEPFAYQPYDFRDGRITTEAQAIASATATRGLTTSRLTTLSAAARASGEPVFIVGDFNEPSHLDWTADTVAAGLHFGKQVAWPVSTTITGQGFSDAFRAVRPDEVIDRGDTWTPGAPPPSIAANEVQDRIDIIYSSLGHATATAALTLGFTTADGVTDIAVPNFPSDHRAVVATFSLVAPEPGAAVMVVVTLAMGLAGAARR